MSDVAIVSAAAGAAFKGPDVSIADLGALGMVAVRGDFASRAFSDAVTEASGAELPAQRRFVETAGGGLGWMAPDELLLLCAYDAAPGIVATLSKALEGEHHLAADVSDARAAFRIEGAGARELIAKGAPVDMAPAAFRAGDLRRSRLGQVAAAFWLGEDGAFTLVCFRSVGAHVFEWLKASAADGARPGIF